MQQLRRLSLPARNRPSFEGGDASPLGEEEHVAMLLLKALGYMGRLSKVRVRINT